MLTVNLSGGLRITLSWQQGAVVEAAVINERPLWVADLLRGKSANEALALVPNLFALCRSAQACAAVMAVEAALEMPVDGEVEQRRAVVVRSETLREYLMRLVSQPGNVLSDADQGAVKRLLMRLGEVQSLCDPDGALFTPAPPSARCEQGELQAVVAALTSELDDWLFAGDMGQWENITEEESLLVWSSGSASVLACMMEQLLLKDWGGSGDTDLPSVNRIPREALVELVGQRDIVRQPAWQDSPCETGVLDVWQGELRDSLEGHFGRGLMTRLVACATNVVRLCRSLLAPSAADRPFESLSLKEHEGVGVGMGVGIVTTARGMLMHRVVLQSMLITDYSVLAPTEWNCHPRGVLRQSLLGLQGDLDAVRAQAEKVIAMIDPCVGYQLEIDARD